MTKYEYFGKLNNDLWLQVLVYRPWYASRAYSTFKMGQKVQHVREKVDQFYCRQQMSIKALRSEMIDW